MQKRIGGIIGVLFCLCFGSVDSLHAQTVEKRMAQAELIHNEHLDNVPDSGIQLSKALERLEEEYDISFMYKTGLFSFDNKLLSKILVPVEHLEHDNLTLVLKKILEPYNLTYSRINNRTFAISFDLTRYATKKEQKAQEQIQGVVTDAESGETLPGVNVIVKGTTTGTSSGSDGTYKLTLESLRDTLVFSFVGYQTREVPIDGRTEIDVALQPQAIAGDELVVIGYGTAQRKDVTGSIGSVNISERAQVESITNLEQFFQGTVPGLNAGLATGPRGSTSLEVRGRNSIQAGNDPLIVLDGAPYYGNLSAINPNDIQSIDVLKDASAAAVYGASAAAGVIEITTKQGGDAEPSITFNSSVGFTENGSNQRPYGPEEYLQQRSDVATRQNPGQPDHYYSDPRDLPADLTLEEWKAMDSATSGSPEEIWLGRIGLASNEIENFMNGKTIDWYDQVYQKGVRTNQNLSLSGREGGLNYYWSLGYTDNNGTVTGSRFKTVRTRLNVETEVADFIRVGIKSQYQNREEGYLSASADQVTYQSPFGDKYEEDGSLRWAPNNDRVAATNPFLYTTESGRESMDNINLIIGNIHAELIDLPFGLGYKVRWNNMWGMVRDYIFNPSTVPMGLPGGNSNRRESTTYDWTLDNILTWNRTIQENHEFDFTFLFNAEAHDDWTSRLANESFEPNENLGFSGIESGENPTVNNNDTRSTGTALMGRLNYRLMDRYLLTVSYRRDGYSAFGESNPYAYFPAAAVGWRLSEEPFFNADFINNLKLRLSWGINGNRSIGTYSALQRYSTADYIYGTSTVKGVYANNLANADLKWEETRNTNIGVDFGLFSDRLSGSINAYQMSTKNLLLQRSLPSITGYENIWANLGEVGNKGLEMSLESRNIQKENFVWQSTFTFSMNRNEIKHLYGTMEDIVDEEGNVIGQKEADDRQNGWFIGHALDQIYDYKVLGVWQTDEAEEAAEYGMQPGDLKLLDVNEDGVLSPVEDKVFQGYTKPRYRLSLGNTFSYKNFDLSTMFISHLDYYGAANIHKHTDWRYGRANNYDVPYWTPENPTNEWARLDSRGENPNFTYWENRSFIRLQNASLAYNFPTSLLQKVNIKSLQAYVNVRNAYVTPLAGWDFWDPETRDQAPRIYSLGINLTF
ncbi:SusC/RagA family TonB-linked outer membrane protein [Fodinibius roseus]|nr:SusC/RagA family TonB-linked outer membrane protein [Fodinibius roseus]